MQVIYQIKNIMNGMIYIGSAQNHIRRWDAHKQDLKLNKHCNSYLQSAWLKYGEEAFQFAIVELVENLDDLIKREQYYLDSTKCYDRTIGYNLCAVANSVLGRKASEETIAKLSAIRKGKPRSEETKAKIAATMKGRKFSDEWKAKLSEAHKGNKHTEETKKLMSERKKGNQINKGRTLTEEHKAAISNGQIGHKLSEETKRKIAEANRGQKRSEESRRRMSEAAKRRHVKNIDNWSTVWE